MGSKVLACIYLSLAMVIVGSSMVFGKIITQSFPVCLASGIRFAIASAIMFPLVLKKEPVLFKIGKTDFFRLVLMAFSGQFIFTMLMLLGLRYTSGIEAGIITSTSPAMMVLISIVLFREWPGIWQIGAVLLVVAGIISVNIGDAFFTASLGSVNLAGNLMMVGAVVGEAIFLLMRKGISRSISNLSLTFYLCVIGFIMFFPFAVYQAIEFDFSAVSMDAWISLVYFGAVFTVLAYLFWFSGVSRVSGTTAGLFSAVMPVSGVTLSCLFLHETFTRAHALGISLVLTAIVVMALVPNSERSQGRNKRVPAVNRQV
ncbi:MAG: DMT family transporter [Desulfobacterales bacterium]|nr:DMT family transporter [Desulfobacterales bacterium]